MMWWKNAIVIQLTRIADAMEVANDWTKEDLAVKKMTSDLKKAEDDLIEAEQNIPPRINPKKGN